MNVSQISIDRGKAAIEYNEYREAIKKNKSAEYLIDLKNAYGHLKRGHPILDVWQAFKETGLDANGDPKIAISRADFSEVACTKLNPDSDRSFQAIFSDKARWPHRSFRSGKLTDLTQDDVTVPNGTWALRTDDKGHLTRTHIRTKVPIIPARFVPSFGLSNYHILWEVEKWDVITSPRDPLLLKRISPNIFTVLAAWELTDLERAVLRGRIG